MTNLSTVGCSTPRDILHRSSLGIEATSRLRLESEIVNPIRDLTLHGIRSVQGHRGIHDNVKTAVETIFVGKDPRPVPLHHRATQAQMAKGFSPSLDEAWGSCAMARFAGAFWRQLQPAQALLPLGCERRLEESFLGLGGRSQQ
jgi:hypothetical protein